MKIPMSEENLIIKKFKDSKIADILPLSLLSRGARGKVWLRRNSYTAAKNLSCNK
jgi:hypothetical protein